VTATATKGSNNHAPVLLRSYTNPLQRPELPEIKLWEAARATSAAPMYFAPMKVKDKTFVDGGLQANNPLGWQVFFSSLCPCPC
jgi:patatin-like phospholipase/acyl hydrolase